MKLYNRNTYSTTGLGKLSGWGHLCEDLNDKLDEWRVGGWVKQRYT